MQIKLKQGILQGGQKKSILTGDEYNYFLGIPYAEPPIGELRFRPPVPAKGWDGIRSAVEEANICYQRAFFDNKTKGCEDCLYLNVYTPLILDSKEPLKSVMVYIHGGGYLNGSGSMSNHGPDYLVPKDIVLVTINYRLHILGFLNLNIEECSGNYGLKDQQLALKWIKQNIHLFGGDPNNITVFGESAGASSVQYQMISPTSKGLFQRAILQSGNVLVPWALTNDSEKKGFAAGKLLGFEGNDPVELVKFLRKQPVEKLSEAAFILGNRLKEKNPWSCVAMAFIPSVEKIKEGAFLPARPEILFETADPIPVICGLAQNEGIIALFGRPSLRSPEVLKTALENLQEIIGSNVPCVEGKISDFVSEVHQFYFENIPADHITKQLINLYSDIYFLHFHKAITYILKSKQPVYVYELTFYGELNQSNLWPLPKIGAVHADELCYMFYSKEKFPQPKFNEPEKNMIDYFCTLWTNFAKTGNPTPDSSKLEFEWKTHTIENPVYLDLCHNAKCVNEIIWQPRQLFWRKLVEKYLQL